MSRLSLQYLVLATSVLSATQAFAWGSYGHQQINVAAVALLQQSATDFGMCVAKNRKYLQRLAITPDYDWKTVGTEPPTPELKHQRGINDEYEHPLHFFEGDAYDLATNVSLFTEVIYSKVLPSLKSALSSQADYVETMDPEKKIADKANPADSDVATHGSSPWRILQLNKLAFASLSRAKSQTDLAKALFYLGANGHYNGDMSQPFHATFDYDGKAAGATGIHHAFEEGILESAAAEQRIVRGADGLFPSFAPTEIGVMASAKKLEKVQTLSETETLASVFHLILSTGSYIEPIEAAYRNAVNEVTSTSGRTLANPGMSQPVFRAYKKLTLVSAHSGETVLQAAETLMGESAALIAQEWMSTVDAARKENPALNQLIKDCPQSPEIVFNLAEVINNYPIPDFLPADSRVNKHPSANPGGPHDPKHLPPAPLTSPHHR